MNITFDPAKDAGNMAKHGVSLALAERLEWDLLLAGQDLRRAYGEVRWIGFAPIVERVYCVVFTERDGQRRVISLRQSNSPRPNSREVNRYAERIRCGT